jgi:hypothetical protein
VSGAPWVYDALAEAIRRELYGDEYCDAKTDKQRERAYKKRCRSICTNPACQNSNKCVQWDEAQKQKEKK